MSENATFKVDTDTALYGYEYMTRLAFGEGLVAVPVTIRGKEINFVDEIWDFREVDPLHRQKSNVCYDFSIFHTNYRHYVKSYLLKYLIIKNSSFTTVYNHIKKLKWIVDKLITFNALKPEYISNYKIRCLINEIQANSEAVRYTFYYLIEDFLRFLEYSIQGADFQESYSFIALSKRPDLIFEEREISKHEIIPEKYLNIMISNAVKILQQETTIDNYDAKVGASIVLLLSQTGMRIGELRLLKAEELEEFKIFNGEKVVKYLTFITYKTSKQKVYEITRTFMTPLAVLGYENLVKLKQSQWIASEDYYLFYNPKNSKISHQLCITEYLLYFTLAFRKELNAVNNTSEEFKSFSKKKISFNKEVYYYLKQSKRYDLEDGDIVTLPKAHQFRVTLCNQLVWKNNIDINIVSEHMNHLSADMTEHYLRRVNDYQNVKKAVAKMEEKYSVERFGDVSSTRERFAFEVESFLQCEGIKIYGTVYDLIYAENNSFINENTLGFCISNEFSSICDMKKKNDIGLYLSSKYNQGFDGLYMTYRRFRDKKLILLHNKKNGLSQQFYLEISKTREMIDKKLLPELHGLKDAISEFGYEEIVLQNSSLTSLIINIDTIIEEVEIWMKESEMQLKSN